MVHSINVYICKLEGTCKREAPCDIRKIPFFSTILLPIVCGHNNIGRWRLGWLHRMAQYSMLGICQVGLFQPLLCCCEYVHKNVSFLMQYITTIARESLHNNAPPRPCRAMRYWDMWFERNPPYSMSNSSRFLSINL